MEIFDVILKCKNQYETLKNFRFEGKTWKYAYDTVKETVSDLPLSEKEIDRAVLGNANEILKYHEKIIAKVIANIDPYIIKAEYKNLSISSQVLFLDKYYESMIYIYIHFEGFKEKLNPTMNMREKIKKKNKPCIDIDEYIKMRNEGELTDEEINKRIKQHMDYLVFYTGLDIYLSETRDKILHGDHEELNTDKAGRKICNKIIQLIQMRDCL